MKIVSWNINSLKARLEHIKKFLQESSPDVLMLQELKGTEFPAEEFTALGYQSVAESQKAYNGVAAISKNPIQVILNILPGDTADEQARYLEFETGGLRLINIYAPNGNPVDSEKYPYKLSWLGRLYERLRHLREERIPFAIGGDFNIIPEDKDCHDPKAWENDALFRLESRAKFRRIMHLGLTDAFRVQNAAPGHYTFWDYQAGAWQQDKGIRIDHFLLSPEAADLLQSCTIDEAPRGWDKPSDHTPIVVEIAA